MKIFNLNFFRKPEEIKKPEVQSYTGKLWVNYTKKINSLTLTSLPGVDIALKIMTYMITVFLVVFITPIALVFDGIKYSLDSTKASLDKLKNKFNKKNETEASAFSYFKLIAGTIGISSLAVTTYAFYHYRIN